MGCNCGKKKTASNTTYTVTCSDGSKKTYSTEIEAKAAAKRCGGTVTAK